MDKVCSVQEANPAIDTFKPKDKIYLVARCDAVDLAEAFLYKTKAASRIFLDVCRVCQILTVAAPVRQQCETEFLRLEFLYLLTNI